MENEALQLELTNQKRRAAAEVESLKQRLTAAELHLEEVKREAEEYQKGSVLHNLETVALGNEVGMICRTVRVNILIVFKCLISLEIFMGENIKMQYLCAGVCTETGHCKPERTHHT